MFSTDSHLRGLSGFWTSFCGNGKPTWQHAICISKLLKASKRKNILLVLTCLCSSLFYFFVYDFFYCCGKVSFFFSSLHNLAMSELFSDWATEMDIISFVYYRTHHFDAVCESFSVVLWIHLFFVTTYVNMCVFLSSN